MSTKERILDAALTLFAENGYDGTMGNRLDDRASNSGFIDKGTIHERQVL